MSDYVTGFITKDGIKKYDYRALANLPESGTDITNTVISPNADYAEVGEWADGNPSREDRLGYFVAIAEVGDNTTKIRKATSTDDVRGVSVYNPAFSGNASKDKYGEDGELLPQYNYIGIMGIVKIIDNGRCSVDGRCMPADDGTAIASTNNMGYAVLERVDSKHVLIAVEPGADMIQRVKTDVEKIEEQLENGGGSGEDGATFTPSVSDEGVISWTNDKGLDNPDPVNIKGEDGVGIASLEKTSTSGLVDTYTITYTDGTVYTFTVTNGQDAEDLSEEITEQDSLIEQIKAAMLDKATVVGILKVEKTLSVGLVDTYTITFTDESTTTFTVTNGIDGIDGVNGKSAYEYAKEGGYTGTEAEFGEKLADTGILGTWTFIDNPNLDTLPDQSTEINFISNGEEFNGIWRHSIGSDSWGIYGMTYLRGNGSYYTAYAYNPEGSYGIEHGWNPVYDCKTITITKAPSDPYIVVWIKENAVKGVSQTQTDARLKTKSKRLVDAINELNDQFAEGGADGVGISKIEKTSTEGLVDTYTITLTDGSTATFTVTNGVEGKDGKSAYEIAVINGFEGTEQEWLGSLVGADGEKGEPGEPGADGEKGEKGEKGDGLEIVTTTGTGAAYEATVRGITELKAGVSFIMIPHTGSQDTTPKLNVNGLGFKEIRRGRSTYSKHADSGYTPQWLSASYPCFVMYNGNFWIVTNLLKPSALDLDGIVPVAKGGVPSTNADNAGKVLTTNASGTPEWQEPSGGNIDLSDYQTKNDESLETADKTVVGAINEVNRKTVDKIYSIDTWYGDMEEVSDDGNGISWANYFALMDDNTNVLSSGSVTFKIPIVAGENVDFSYDEENNAIAINATSGDTIIDKTDSIDFWYGDKRQVGTDGSDGITWNETSAFLDGDENELKVFTSSHRVPISAGENVTFSYDGESNTIKINATGSEIDTSDLATVDKITHFDFNSGGTSYVEPTAKGIFWENDETEIEIDGGEDYYYSSSSSNCVPIVAGDNIAFEVDEEKKVVKINATSGGFGNIEYIDMYYGDKSSVHYDTDAPEVGITWSEEFAFLDGGDNEIKTASSINRIPIMAGDNVTFTVDEGEQIIKINANELPSYDSTNEGQFLRIVGGTPAWSAIPNAEEVAF